MILSILTSTSVGLLLLSLLKSKNRYGVRFSSRELDRRLDVEKNEKNAWVVKNGDDKYLTVLNEIKRSWKDTCLGKDKKGSIGQEFMENILQGDGEKGNQKRKFKESKRHYPRGRRSRSLLASRHNSGPHGVGF